jgi:hypothetical protein
MIGKEMGEEAREALPRIRGMISRYIALADRPPF